MLASDGGSQIRLWLERALVVIGVSGLGWAGLVLAQTRLELSRARAAVGASESGPTSGTAIAETGEKPVASASINRPPGLTANEKTAAAETLTGVFEIPRLGLSAALAEGDDDATLRTAIGHLPDTSLPWRGGNTAVAGHRDNLFRALRDIRIGDTIRLRTPQGTFDYAVRTTVIVKPEDVWVVAPTSTDELTLVTCYPFSFIGHAPHRYIVKADRIGG